MRRTRPIAISLMLMSLGLACRPADSADMGDSSVNAIENALAIGKLHPKAAEVLIYYANETRPDEPERVNLDYIISIMRRSPNALVLDAAKKIDADATDFALAVDKDIAELEAAVCGSAANKALNLIVFDNKTARDGKFRACIAGSGTLKPEEAPSLASVYAEEPFKSDSRYHASPLASKAMLDAALKIARERFHPARHSFTLITKSHGSSERAVGVRLAIQGKIIRSEQNGEARFLKAIEAMAKKREDALDAAVKARLTLQDRIIAFLASVPDSHPLKDGLLKDAILKDGLLKDAILKDAILKDAILKDAILKDAILKDAILKDAILKDAILKDAILKDAILKDGILKDAILKDGILASDDPPIAQADDILAKAVGTPVGISKRDWLAAITTQNDAGAEKRMEFPVVFAESCESYLSWDLMMDIAEADWNPNIGVLFTSDVKGLESYRTVDYAAYFKEAKWDEKFATQFAAKLDELADQQKREN